MIHPSLNEKDFRHIFVYPGSINNLWSLLSPVALDLRTLQNGMTNVATPYLDVQMNLPLLVIALALFYVGITSRRSSSERSQWFLLAVMITSALLFGLALAIIVNPSLSGSFGCIFDVLQFSYRLMTY
jgi:hypothetical protein